jgi:hypothetical protein
VKKLEQTKVEIIYQDRTLGDSDEKTQGATGELIMHKNKSKFVNEMIQNKDWFIEMSCDERYYPEDWERLRLEVKYAQKHGFDSVAHTRMFEPVQLSSNQLVYDANYWLDTTKPYLAHEDKFGMGFSINWGLSFKHCRFQQKTEAWEQSALPHHSFKNTHLNSLISTVPIWHFHRLKNGILPNSWRDAKGSISRLLKKHNQLVPLLPLYTPFMDWANLQDLSYESIDIPFRFESVKVATESKPEVPEEPVFPVKSMFELKVPPRKLNVLLIGEKTSFCATTQIYYDLFLNNGYNVVWVGKGAPNLDFSGIPMKQILFSGLLGNYPLIYREFKLQSLLDMFKIDFDVIIQCQDQTYFTETTPSKIPFIYIMPHIHEPRISPCVSMILCQSQNSIDQLKYYLKEPIPIGYLPHALNTLFANLDKPKEKKTLVSYSGEIYSPRSLYNDRRNTVHYLKQELKERFTAHWMCPPNMYGVREPEMGLGRLSQSDYKELLLDSQFGINCPTKSGFNFRDLEIPATRAILLTKRNRDLDLLGFKDHVNCLYYDTPEECLDLIQNGEYDEKIAEAGYQLVNQHTYQTRFMELQRIIQELLKV